MKYAAIFVLYHPESELLAHIASIFPEVDYLFLYKNSEIDPAIADKIVSHFSSKLILLGDGNNNGIARALNDGLAQAKKYACDWLITMDQDSFMERSVITQLKERAENKAGNCLVFSPDLLIGDRPAYGKDDQNYWIMTSCNFLRTSAADLIGPFIDDYFIDGVDIEFCLRLQHLGYHFQIEKDLYASHALGSKIEGDFLGKKVLVTHYSPLRKYYISRNYLDIVFTRKAAVKPRIFILSILLSRIVDSMLYDTDKRESFTMIGLGIWHFLVGVKGKLSGY